MRLIVVNTDWRLISLVRDICHEITGRKTACYERPPIRGRAHTCWSVEITRRGSLVAVLTAIEPYLVAKRERAQLALQILAARKRSGPEVDAAILAAAERIKWCNNNPATPMESVETGRAPVAIEGTVQ